jgi:hypothetical protein
MRRTANVAEMRNAYAILVRNLKERNYLGDLSAKGGYNKMDLKRIGC